MNQEITIDDIKGALSQLPEELRAELQDEAPQIDSVAVKLELIKFTVDLHKHNQGVDWETNKVKPKKITFDQVISDSQKLYDFLVD